MTTDEQAVDGGGRGLPPAPAVSIIVPAYNVAAYIGEALDSVFAQTFNDYEVIVINDGSPDTPALERALEPYRGRIVYLKQENGGLSAARNAGIRAARAPWIALLDADDAWEPDYLAVQLAELARDPAVDVLYPNALVFGDAAEAGQDFMTMCPSAGEVTFESLVAQRCTVMISVLARREAIVRAGMFDEDRGIRGSEDFDLWLRIVKQGGRIAYHRRPLVRYRRRAGSLSSDPVRMCEDILRRLEKARARLELTPAERRALDSAAARFRALLDLNRGKRAFFQGKTADAVAHLRAANRRLGRARLTLAIWGLRLAPRLLRRAYDFRDRFILRADTKF
jgi:glycosyltransferase involved in cell wall biosynthesis